MAGDLSNRDITAGAPDAILDMKYGNSYDRLITKAYKGSTLIFEREIENWLYHIENVNCNRTHTMASYDEYQPENIYYIAESIFPMSYENIYRDWEFLINVTPTTTGQSTIPIFTETLFGSSDPNYQEYVNTIGGPEIEFYFWLEVNTGNNPDRIRFRGTSSIFSSYNGNNQFDSWLTYNVGDKRISGKDIRISKTSEFISGENVHKIEIYISGYLIATLKYDPKFSCKSRVGSIMRRINGSNNGYFDGAIKYFKFRFNSDPSISDFTIHPLVLPSFGEQSGSTETTIVDAEKETITEVTKYACGTTYCIETIVKIHYYDPSKEDEQHHDVTNNRGGWDSPAKSPYSWGWYYNQLIDSDYDGFGVTVSLEDDYEKYYDTFFDDNTGSELIQRFADYYKGSGAHASPFLLNGGGSASQIGGGIQVIYDKTKHGSDGNSINLMGNSANDFIKSGGSITAIYFNKTQQMVLFDGSKTLYISSAYTPSVYDSSSDKGCYLFGCDISGDDVCTTLVPRNALPISLFRIKYKTEEEA